MNLPRFYMTAFLCLISSAFVFLTILAVRVPLVQKRLHLPDSSNNSMGPSFSITDIALSKVAGSVRSTLSLRNDSAARAAALDNHLPSANVSVNRSLVSSAALRSSPGKTQLSGNASHDGGHPSAAVSGNSAVKTLPPAGNSVDSGHTSAAVSGNSSVKTLHPAGNSVDSGHTSAAVSGNSSVASGSLDSKHTSAAVTGNSSVQTLLSGNVSVDSKQVSSAVVKNPFLLTLLSRNTSVDSKHVGAAASGNSSIKTSPTALDGSALSKNRSTPSSNSSEDVLGYLVSKRPFNNHSSVPTVLPTPSPTVPLVSMAGKIVGKDFFHTVISPVASCAGRDIELVICVSVKRDDAVKRGVIRLTWGSYGQHGGRGHIENVTNSNGKSGEIILIFFIGSSALQNSTAEQEDIEEEARTFGDIHQADFIDTYNNLTLKSISIVQYISLHCPNARYIAKVDDDVYVNIPVLLTVLRDQTQKLLKHKSKATHGKNFPTATSIHGAMDSYPASFALGLKFDAVIPIRDKKNKWYTPEESYKSKRYPSYLSGTAYFMSGRAALSIYQATLRTPVFWLEDVYITGMCARKARVRLVNKQTLMTVSKPTSTACSFMNRISGHGYRAWEILKIHESFKDRQSKC